MIKLLKNHWVLNLETECTLAGGFLRDVIWGIAPKDIDLYVAKENKHDLLEEISQIRGFKLIKEASKILKVVTHYDEPIDIIQTDFPRGVTVTFDFYINCFAISLPDKSCDFLGLHYLLTQNMRKRNKTATIEREIYLRKKLGFPEMTDADKEKYRDNSNSDFTNLTEFTAQYNPIVFNKFFTSSSDELGKVSKPKLTATETVITFPK